MEVLGKLTFKVGSSFPAKASNKVVFPELGGPRSNVILQASQAFYMNNRILNTNSVSKTALTDLKSIHFT